MDSGHRTTRVYVAGNHSRKWHIARQRPTGFNGVHALCGASWNEGWYVEMDECNAPLVSVDIALCRSCEKAAERT